MVEEKNYLKGIIGSIIGGLVATIPWVLMYVYGGRILAILAILVGLGAWKGYTLFKGKEDKKLYIIVSVVSVFCITFATLIVTPLLLLGQNEFEMSLSNLKILYQQKEFFSAMMGDYAISMIFTAAGIAYVIGRIKNTLESPKESIETTDNKNE